MNKKLLSILALVLMVCVLLASCQEPAPVEPPHEHTFDTAAWQSDATMHWHKATCEHTSEMKDVQGHIDANKDGICDVCAYAENHTHTFVEDWSYDATGHWHVANCFHDVKSEVVAHTADGMGFCTACGYKVSDPDVSTVKKAVEMGIAQKKTVKGGTIVDAYGGITEFEYRNGYLYVCKGSDQYYYSLDGNGDIFAVYVSWGEATADPNATLDNLNGPAINLDFMDTCFGTEDLIETLYAMASVDNLNGDFAESVAEGVYSFSFGHYYGEYQCLYKVAVSFTLNETTYAFENVEITLNEYSYGTYTEVPGVGEAPATYTVNEGAKPWVNTMSINQGIDIKNPYDPVKLSPTDYSLSVEGEAVTDAITIMKGENLYVYFENVKPDGASMGFAVVELTGANVNLAFPEDLNAEGIAAWKNSLKAVYEPQNGVDFFTLSSDAAAGTTYTLKVSVNGVEKTLTVTVAEPTPNFIVAGEFVDGMDGTSLFPTTSMTIQQGANANVGAYLDVQAGQLIFTVDGNRVNDMLLNSFGVYDMTIWDYAYGMYLSLSELEVGTHTITITATANAELTATVTVTVTAAEGGEGGEGGLAGNGSEENPFVITAPGTFTANASPESDVYYTYTPTEDVELTLSATDDFFIRYGVFSFMLLDKSIYPQNPTATISLTAGQTLYMQVGSNFGISFDITFTLAAAGGEGGEGGDVEVGDLTGTYTGTNGPASLVVTLDATTATFTHTAMSGFVNTLNFNYAVVNDTIVLTNPDGTPAMMMYGLIFSDGALTAVYEGWEYPLAKEGGSGDVGGDEPASLNGVFVGTSEFGTTIKVEIIEADGVILFIFVDPRLGMETQDPYNYVLEGDVMTLYNMFDGTPVTMPMQASVVLEGGVLISCIYNGTTYTNFGPEGEGEPATEIELEMGDTQINDEDGVYVFTAAEAGKLTLTTGAALGEVTFVYTVNGGDEMPIALQSTVELELFAGDKVTITVTAAGYSSISASFTAGTTGGEGGEVTPPPATGDDDSVNDDFAGAN